MADPSDSAGDFAETRDQGSVFSTHRLYRALDFTHAWRRRHAGDAARSHNGTSGPPDGMTSATRPYWPSQDRQLQVDQNDIDRWRSHPRRSHSTTSGATISTQPVLVRAYSGKSRQSSRARSSGAEAHSQTNLAAASTQAPTDAKLPSVEDFKFSHLLVAVEPDIHSAIDSIARICARSRLSLADEYGAHLPPFTHTMPSMPRTRGSQGPQKQRNLAQLGRTNGRGSTHLTTVPETSSSSEHSSPSTTSGSGSSRGSAYGSLTKVLRRNGPAGRGEHSGSVKGTQKEIEEISAVVASKRHIASLLQRVSSAPPSIVTETTTVMRLEASHRLADGEVDERSADSLMQHRSTSRTSEAKDAEAQLKIILQSPAPG